MWLDWDPGGWRRGCDHVAFAHVLLAAKPRGSNTACFSLCKQGWDGRCQGRLNNSGCCPALVYFLSLCSSLLACWKKSPLPPPKSPSQKRSFPEALRKSLCYIPTSQDGAQVCARTTEEAGERASWSQAPRSCLQVWALSVQKKRRGDCE